MNNNERMTWLAGLVLLAFYSINQNDKVSDLQVLYESNVLQTNIQSSHIDELHSKISEQKDASYARGFTDGESRAMISFIKGKPLKDYSDGYHAALSQFNLSDIPHPKE